jgi:hypothetical protein
LSNDEADGGFPMQVFVPKSNMVPSKPNSIKNINHTSFNHQLTLWGPVSIQELPEIIYIDELN